MKKNELTTIRKKSVKELLKQVETKQTELSKEMVELSIGKATSPKKKQQLKHDIAQIFSIISEKRILTDTDSIKEKESKIDKKEKK